MNLLECILFIVNLWQRRSNLWKSFKRTTIYMVWMWIKKIKQPTYKKKKKSPKVVVSMMMILLLIVSKPNDVTTHVWPTRCKYIWLLLMLPVSFFAHHFHFQQATTALFPQINRLFIFDWDTKKQSNRNRNVKCCNKRMEINIFSWIFFL